MNKRSIIKLLFVLVIVFFNIDVNAQFPRFSVKFDRFSSSNNNACNDFKGNWYNAWKPSHGSPNSKVYHKVRLVVSDGSKPDYKVKGEGLYIDLTANNFNIESNKYYRANFSYQKRDTRQGSTGTTFRAYLANGMNESSDNSCKESVLPSVADKQKVYHSNDYLYTTYTNQVKQISVEFKANKSYKYLWIYSDLLTQFNSGTRNEIVITDVSLEYILTPEITNNTISSDETIYIGKTASRITGSTPGGGNGSFTYQWQKRTTGSWTTIANATGKNYSPGALTTTTEYRRKVTSGNQSNFSRSVTKTVKNYPNISNNTISGNQTITEGNRPVIFNGSTPRGGDGGYQFQWQKKIGNSWSNISGATSRNYHSGVLNSTTVFRRQVKSVSFVNYSNSITVNVNLLPSITNNTISFDGNNKFIGSTPIGGDGNYKYSWYAMFAFTNEDAPQPIYQFGKNLIVNKYEIENATHLQAYYRRGVTSGNKYSYTSWQTIFGPLRNNTISFDGISKIIGSQPKGGINKYTYDYYITMDLFDGLEQSMDNSTNKDLVLPSFYVSLLNAYPDARIEVIRVVKSGNFEKSSTKIVFTKNSSRSVLSKTYSNRNLLYDDTSITVYPNPTSRFVNFKTNFYNKRNVEIKLSYFNSSSSDISVYKGEINSGNNTLTWKFPKDARKGLYVYSIISEGKIISSGKIILK